MIGTETLAATVVASADASMRMLRGSGRNLGANDNGSFLMFASIVVGLILLCYVYCMYQVIRVWCCRQRLVHQDEIVYIVNPVFNLNPKQRRAVLEAIFSETSKSVTATSPYPKKIGDTDETDIPIALTLESKEDVHDSDMEQSSTDLKPVVMKEVSSDCAEMPPPVNSTVLEPFRDNPTNIRRSFPWQKRTIADAPQLFDESLLVVPALTEEESKEEDLVVLGLQPFCQDAKEEVDDGFFDADDEEMDEDVCPICLSSYEEGDVVVSSKYCLHLFHKDCLLEWLEKHDICPCCRVDMVTDGDVNKAATIIVGKTRMVTAVQSINAVLTPPPSPTGRVQRQSPRVRRMGGSHR